MLNFKKTKSNAFKCVAAMLLLLTIAMVGLVGCGEEEVPAVMTGITISAQPTKTIYEVGDKFDYSGAKVTVTYDDGTTAEVDVTAAMIDLYKINFNKKGSQDITVTYTAEDGTTKSAVITVTVIDTLGDKKAEQIKVINDYTDLKDSTIAALKATYINSVNAADDAAEIETTVKAYKDAVDAYKTASTALATAITNAKSTINGTKVDGIPASLIPTVNEFKATSLAALELAGSADEAKGIADAYVAAIAEIKKDLDYRLEVDAAAVAAYTKLAAAFRVEEETRAPYYLAADWAKIVAIYDDAKAVVLRADDIDTINKAVEKVTTEVAKIKSILDILYDMIVDFGAKSTEEIDGYKFIVFSEAEFQDEVDAIIAKYNEIAADAVASTGLSIYTDRNGVAHDLTAYVNTINARFNTELPAALADAAVVIEAIENIPEILLYEQFKDSAIEGMNVAYYVTIKSDFTAVAATVENWLVTYKMLVLKSGADYTFATEFSTDCIIDPNVDDMVTNYADFAALVARKEALKNSAADLAAIKIADKLNPLLNNSGVVALTDDEALAAIEAEVAAWLEKYDLTPARIADYDEAYAEANVLGNMNLAEDYYALRWQREYLESMKDAKAYYEANIKADFEAFNAIEPIFTTEYKGKLQDIYETLAEWIMSYGVVEGYANGIDEENGLLIMTEATYDKFMERVERFAELVERDANKNVVTSKIDAIYTEINKNDPKVLTLDELDELVAAWDALEEWAAGKLPESGDIDDTDPDNPVIDEDTRHVLDEANIKAILGDYYKKLTDAQAAADAIMAEHKPAADAVNALIDAIGTVTKESEAAIEAARKAFDEFIDTIDAITETLSEDDIADAFGLKKDTLVAAEGALVACYIADIYKPYTTENIPAAIKAIEVYIDWTGYTTYSGGNIAEAIEAIEDVDGITDVLKFPTYAAIFNEIEALISDDANDTIAKFNEFEIIVDELTQLSLECNTLNNMIAALPPVKSLTLGNQAEILKAEYVYNSFLNNNSNITKPIVDESKLTAAIVKMDELQFNENVRLLKLAIETDATLYKSDIDESTQVGSVWFNSITRVADEACAKLDLVKFDDANADAVVDKIATDARALIKDHYDSYRETVGITTPPVTPAP